MTRIEPAAIATIILNAPGWARVGITVPDETLRDAAADELARVIVDQMEGPFPEPFNADQFALAL